MEALSLDRPVLAAESAGATMALLAAGQHLERFTGLVLVDGLIHHDYRDETDPFAVGIRTNFAATIDRFAAACVSEDEPDSAAIRRWGVQILNRSGRDAAAALYNCLSGIDLRPRAPEMTLPVLLIHGEADAMVPVNDSRELAAALPHSALHLIPGAGHVPTMTHPADVAAAIDRFFDAGTWPVGATGDAL
jgi:pimeloyl-ACP methyl ester carboxylesterase